MNSTEKKLTASWLLLLILIVASSVNVNAQSPRDETQTPATAGTITGRVVTESGQPLPYATVYLRGSMPLFQPRITATDSEGNFQAAGLEPLLYGVSAMVPAYVSPPRDPDTPPTYYRIGDSVTLTLVKGGVISGTVVSTSGEPVVQVSVQAVLVRDANGQRPKYGFYQSQKLTDDRGIYRIYGLLPGTYVVSAGGRGSLSFAANPYANDSPTYAPSSTRDTAAEITVRAGEEANGVNIRYRGEPGHVISGVANGPTDPNSYSQFSLNLTQISNGVPMSSIYGFQAPNGKGFSFYGLADGDYDLVAQSSVGLGEMTASEPRRISVKGADVTGIELTIKPLGAIGGHLALAASDAVECKNKRQPLLSETLIAARRSEKGLPKDGPRFPTLFGAQGTPNKSGDFLIRNLAPGQYDLNVQFFAKYWYLKSITREGSVTPSVAGRVAPAARQTDAARNGMPLKFGERITGLTVTLAGGAASFRGTVGIALGENVPPSLYVHLVPAEKENVEDVLRLFAGEVNSDGTFALNNLPPGRYWAVARVAADNETQSVAKLRSPDEVETRAQIRRAAEAAKTEIEFKPCQNVSDYRLPFKPAPAK
ncbi:MAG TPA: hypothetical protein DHU55_12320 [Blastocatellia bacterium]|nr:hypothetical protein [Blastocatellia bacterium]